MMKKVVWLSLVMCASAFAGDPKGAPAADAKKMPPADAKPPGPPQEIADMAKSMGGTWKCTGKVDRGGTLVDLKGTIANKTDLDGFWIQTTLTATADKSTMHGMFMTTYDPGTKKWFRTTANGHGGHSQAWGTAEGQKVSWEGDAHFMGKDLKVRATDDMVSAKEAHMTGDYSDDGGKTWKTDHDVTCKK